jgi:chemotaxis protein CheZ
MLGDLSSHSAEIVMTTVPPKIDEAHAYLDKVIDSLQALDRREKQPLLGILQYLSDYIRTTRGEIAAMRSTDGTLVDLPKASDELEEVVVETARATNTIMSVAEEMEEISREVDPPLAKQLMDAATRIYEACTFQDITGQRINKIVRAVQHIDQKIALLSKVCGMEFDRAIAADGADARERGDEALLNGPQVAATAQSQDDIDRLFNS